MKARWVLGAATLAGVLALSGAVARADDDTKAELEKYKQKTEALEKKVEQIEATEAQRGATVEEQIQKATEKLSQEQQKGAPQGFRVYWDQGLHFASADSAFTGHVGGRIQMDAFFDHQSDQLRKDVGYGPDGAEMRRTRLTFDGSIFGDTFDKLEYDFAASGALKSAYMGIRDLVPGGTVVTVGHQWDNFGMEAPTNDAYLTFMEFDAIQAFNPSYNWGVKFANTAFDKRATWAVGGYKYTQVGDIAETGSAKIQDDADYDLVGRLTALPLYKNNGEQLVHLGIDGAWRNPNNEVLDFSRFPEMHLAPTFVNTGNIKARRYEETDAEAATVLGPFSASGEFTHVWVQRDGDDGVTFSGAYVETSYFLTGEHRGYDTTNALWTATKVKRNFGTLEDGTRGYGAWQVAARYSYLDLTDGDVRGGRMEDVTLGLNWYLNPSMRIELNYVNSVLLDKVQPGKATIKGGVGNMLGMRFQVLF